MNYSEILDKLKQYYSNTLIVQYHGKPKAKQTIEMLVELVFQNLLLLQIRDAFDWRTATGKQLDIIGQWVGVSRIYNNNPLIGNKLAYPQYSRIVAGNYDAQQGGYSNYNTFGDDNGGIVTYKDMTSIDNTLPDDEYRIVIGLKIIYNNIQNTVKEIDEAIFNYFGQYLYTKDYPTTSTSSSAYYRFYTDEKCKNLFGVVYPNALDHYQGEAGYYRFFRTNSTQVIAQEYCKPIEQVQYNLYRLQYSSVYTTWNTNVMELTYHYPADTHARIMQVCLDKGVLPAPTGTKIQFGGY